MKNTKLIVGNIYNGWRYNGQFKFRNVCDNCQKVRASYHEFIHPDTPYGDNWQGFKYAVEPLRFGSECVKEFIKRGI